MKTDSFLYCQNLQMRPISINLFTHWHVRASVLICCFYSHLSIWSLNPIWPTQKLLIGIWEYAKYDGFLDVNNINNMDFNLGAKWMISIQVRLCQSLGKLIDADLIYRSGQNRKDSIFLKYTDSHYCTGLFTVLLWWTFLLNSRKFSNFVILFWHLSFKDIFVFNVQLSRLKFMELGPLWDRWISWKSKYFYLFKSHVK